MSETSLALEMKGVTKRFPGVLANDSVDFQLRKGEIHALLGENGAGKSTLMNILYGLYTPDEGTVYLDGREATIKSPADAISQGIGMVHQHFMLIPVMTVAENIVLGHEITSGPFMLDPEEADRTISALSERFGLAVEPDALVEDLPVGLQQRVEIIKALYREANILILDEPTAVLTPQEIEELFKIMRSLTAQGKSIIFITHKLKEVFAIADRITVLRGGKLMGSVNPEEATEASLAAMMVGREVILTVPKGPSRLGEPILEVRNLSALDEREQLALDGIGFTVHAGEILGIAGVQGNGQTELVEVLTGLRAAFGGTMIVAGHDVSGAKPRTITEEGVAHIPEDRHLYGMVATYPVADNLILCSYYLPPYSHGVVLQNRTIAESAERVIDEFDIRTPSVYTPGSSLSGGNQQKMVVARELNRPIKLLIAAQPTRGLDVGSIEFIHRRIVEQRDHGVAVLLVSAELDEIMSLSDRIAVMYHGRIMDTLAAEGADRASLGLLMAGIKAGETH